MLIFIFHYDRTIVLFLCLNIWIWEQMQKMNYKLSKEELAFLRLDKNKLLFKRKFTRYTLADSIIIYSIQQTVKCTKNNKNENSTICGLVGRGLVCYMCFYVLNLKFGKTYFPNLNRDIPSSVCLLLLKCRSFPFFRPVADPSSGTFSIIISSIYKELVLLITLSFSCIFYFFLSLAVPHIILTCPNPSWPIPLSPKCKSAVSHLPFLLQYPTTWLCKPILHWGSFFLRPTLACDFYIQLWSSILTYLILWQYVTL